MIKKEAVFTGKETSTGPYSPAIVVGDTVYVSGEGPIDPETQKITGENIEEQAELTLKNIQRTLRAAGCDTNDCVKVTVYLSDMANYDKFNTVYKKFFDRPYPARTLVQSVLWHHIMVEIDVIAMREISKKEGQ